tara:strand:+ start:767 stop:1267 length:501 start_codon:yes stop_codon:yes gene_type:complete
MAREWDVEPLAVLETLENQMKPKPVKKKPAPKLLKLNKRPEFLEKNYARKGKIVKGAKAKVRSQSARAKAARMDYIQNADTLAAYIQRAILAGPRSCEAIVEAVHEAGYMSASKNFPGLVRRELGRLQREGFLVKSVNLDFVEGETRYLWGIKLVAPIQMILRMRN